MRTAARVRSRTIAPVLLLVAGLLALGLLAGEATAQPGTYEVFEDEPAFYAALSPDTLVVVDFDHFPDGNPVPTGYDPAGNWSGFEIVGGEWSSLGVTLSTPSEQPLSTVHITEFPEGNLWHSYSSSPNSLTPGQPPFVGYGVPHGSDTGDSLYISLDPPRWAVGLVFVDNSPSGEGEHVEFRAADGSMIADLPSPMTGYLSFLGIISDVPIATVEVFEETHDGDDVSYDDIVYGTPVGLTVEATVDIKPGSATNPVNLKSKGVIPVAILTTDDFDATTVDPISVAFGPAGANEAHGRGHLSDVDGDGDIDLMLHFRTQKTGIQPGHTEACLTAQTFDGQTIVGCDLITTRRSTNKVAKVTGTYEYITITGSWRAASISAQATDPVKGTWTWTAEGTTYRGPITCLRVSGDEAWLAGPDWEGPGGVFMYVQDGGTPGRNGDTTFTWHTDLGEAFEEVEELCEDTVKPPWFGLYPWPVVSGNLNVWDVP